MSVDKSLLFKPRLPEDEVEVPGIGTVRVRALSRIEAKLVQDAQGGWDAQERRILRLGMVDPEITEDEARRWQEASTAGEIDPVTAKITELSGMNVDSKSDLQGVRGEPGSGVRVLPGAEAGDDGGADAPGDD